MAPRHEGARVLEADFELSAPGVSSAPPADLPEVALAGRSNVGKSSLFNALVGHKGLARTSRTPGRTRLLNFFRLRVRDRSGDEIALRIADLPGYGYAAMTARERAAVATMVESYFGGRPALVGVMLLVDARRGFGELDRELLAYTSLPRILVATKADKLPRTRWSGVAREIATAAGCSAADVVLTSTVTGVGLPGDGAPGELPARLVELVRRPVAPGART